MFVLFPICGCQNRWKCDKIYQKINHAFWGSLGSLLGAFGDPLGLPGGRWGWFGEPFGTLWGSLGSPLGAFGGAWGLLCGSLGSLGAPGALQAWFWDFSRKLWVPFWLHFGILLGRFFVSLEASPFSLIFDCFWCAFGSDFAPLLGISFGSFADSAENDAPHENTLNSS